MRMNMTWVFAFAAAVVAPTGAVDALSATNSAGDGLMTAGLLALTTGVSLPKGQNGVDVFASPEKGK